MPQRSNAFQRIVALVNTGLAGQATVTESAMVLDKVTHELREVDVLISARAASYAVHIALEVVARSRPAGTPWVESMSAKHANLSTDKLILVSESGFTKPALAKAHFYGHEAITVERACATDWSLLAALTANGVFELTTLKYDARVVCTFDAGRQEQIVAPLNATFPAGDQVVTLDSFVRRLLERPEVMDTLNDNIKAAGDHEFWIAYTEANGLWNLEQNGEKGKVTELRIGLRVTRSESPVEFTSGKYVDTSFVAGLSVPGVPPLQFVFLKRPDGTVHGLLSDNAGIRTLFPRSSASVPIAT